MIYDLYSNSFNNELKKGLHNEAVPSREILSET